MKYGFISDIHGNYDGLNVAVFHLKSLGCEVACLGDIVSENSRDNEKCLQLLMEMNIQTVRGGHDDICVKCHSPKVSKAAADYLQSQPEVMAHGDMLCVHDNPLEKARRGQGMWKGGSYIRSQTESAVVFEDFLNDHNEIRYVFIGHTHTANVFSSTREISVRYNRPMDLSANPPYIINPGNIGGALRGGVKGGSYLVLDKDRCEVTFFRVQQEGQNFVNQNRVNKTQTVSFPRQNQIFQAYSHESPAAAPDSAGPALPCSNTNPLMFHINKNLSVCGYSGISSISRFKQHGFDAQLQCDDGFEAWLSHLVEVKNLPFKDGAPIPNRILAQAYEWLGFHWEKDHKILISCAAGESRSVSMAVGLLFLKAGLPFSDACESVFLKIPGAYPHPKTLVSVAVFCGVNLDMETLRKIYDKIEFPPPFPWENTDLAEAL